MDLHVLSGLAVQASIFLIVFSLGLDATLEDAAYLLKRPGFLLRSVAAISIIVPAFATLVAAALPLTPVVKLGIVLMAVSPVPPALPGKQLKLGGRKSYVYGLLVAVSLLSIVIVPLTMSLLSAAFGADVKISPGAVARVILGSVVLPLAIGMIIRRIAPSLAQRAAPLVSKLAGLLLIVGVLPILIGVAPAMWRLVGNGTVLAIMAVVIVGLLAGHYLGGPDPRDRATLAISSAMRHPGIALLIAGANVADPEIAAAILLFLIVALVVTLPYQMWSKRRYAMPAGVAGDAD
ncbi:MAG: bile acid:Na+ symporter, family [Burkholderiales bacterium]